MKTTLKDVAEAAGVSPMAVSVVLNGTGGNKVTVADEKAERIRKVASELKYRPNTIARSLRSKKTGTVAVVFQHFGTLSPTRPYRIQVLNGVTEALFPKDYTLALCPKLMSEEGGAFLSDGRFDGILWCRPDFSGDALDAIQSASVPVVLMHAPPGAIRGVPTFSADNVSAMHRVVQHLIDLGHRRIAFVIDPISVNSVEGQARWTAFHCAAIQAGLPEPGQIILPLDHSYLMKYRDSDRPHTAFAVFSDELAGNILISCANYGIDVPGDLSIVGFDSSWFCDQTKPRLTSIKQPVERMAFDATTHLLSLIRNSEEGKPFSNAVSSVYDCDLDVRESTGALKLTEE